MCDNSNDESDPSRKKKWWVRIALTTMLTALTLALVLGTIYNRVEQVPQNYILDKPEFTVSILPNTSTTEPPRSTFEAVKKELVYAEHPFCEVTGSKILSRGGTAVDAAIAMLFCQGVVEPHKSGLGGGFLMMVYLQKARHVLTLDALPVAPEVASPKMFDATERPTGWLTAGIPGECVGLWEAHKKYGRLPWDSLVKPSIDLANQGFPVSKHLAKSLKKYEQNIREDSNLKKLFVNRKTKKLLKEGDLMSNKQLAKTLSQIAAKGGDYLYKGEMATVIDNEIREKGGIIDVADLKKYKAKWLRSMPYVFKDRNGDFHILHLPPPPNNAMLMGMIHNIIHKLQEDAAFQYTESSINLVKVYHIIIEAMKHAFASKEYMGDSSEASNKQIYKFLNHKWGSDKSMLINFTTTFPPNYYIHSDRIKVIDIDQSEGVTNIMVVSAEGDAVVASSMLNDPFGIGETLESLGVPINNAMLLFTRIKNNDELQYNLGNVAHGHKTPITAICPVMIMDFSRNLEVLAAGAGNFRIPTSLVLVLMRHYLLGQNFKTAISELRFHHQLKPDEVIYEAAERNYIFEYLRNYGHTVRYTLQDWPRMIFGLARSKIKIVSGENEN